MPINSRAKGQRGERMVAESLNVVAQRVCLAAGVPIYKLSRNLVQSRNGGHDLVGLDWIAIEVKWYNEIKAHLPRWWDQCLKQATAVNAEPVLIYKANGSKWLVRMWGLLEIERGRRLRVTVDISMEAFLVWFEKRLELEIKKTGLSQNNTVGLFD